MKSLIQAIVRRLYCVEIRGSLPTKLPERTVIIANHQSFLDGLMVSLALPADALFIVHTTVLQNPLFRILLKLVPHLAVDTSSPHALKAVVRLIEQGRPVVIFPEGRLTTTGALMKIYDGAAFLAAKSAASVFHVTIDGLLQTPFSRVSHLFKRRWFPKVTMTLHPEARISLPPEGAAREKRKAAAESMRQLMMANRLEAEPGRTLYQAFLSARELFGPEHLVTEEAQLKAHAETGKEEVAFVADTYNSLLKKTLAIRAVLSRHTAAQEYVGVLLPNSSGAVAVILGLSAANRVPAMLNYTVGAESLNSALTAAQIKTIITSRLFVEKASLGPMLTSLAGVTILYAEDLKQEVTYGDKLAVLRGMLNPGSTLPTGQCAADPALVLFTSGSESRPKGVVHTHASLLANVAQIRLMADFTPRDKFMTALPLFHSFGLTAGTLLPLVNGCPVFFYPNPLKFRVVPELVYDRGCTVLFGTSTFLAGYGRFAHPYDFSKLRYVISGAEKLSAAVRQLWVEKFGVRILEGYGATECAPVISVNTPMAAREGTVGKAVPGLQLALEPAEGIQQGGVLHVKGPNLMAGYLRYEQPGVIEPPASSKGLGWYSTGDIVTLDREGYLKIEGRLKRFAKVGGEMIPLEAVERMILAAEPKHQHAVVARPDEAKGEQLVVFTTAAVLTRSGLAQAARAAGCSELYVPRKIVQLDKLPMLGALKVDYVRLAALAKEFD